MSADDDIHADAVQVHIEQLLLRAPAAAAACGISTKHWYRLGLTGRTPLPIDLNGVSVWPMNGPAGLIEWVAAGCPSRCQFNGNGNTAGPGVPRPVPANKASLTPRLSA